VRRSAYDAVSSPLFFGASHVVVVTVFPPLSSFFSVSLNHEALMPRIFAELQHASRHDSVAKHAVATFQIPMRKAHCTGKCVIIHLC